MNETFIYLHTSTYNKIYTPAFTDLHKEISLYLLYTQIYIYESRTQLWLKFSEPLPGLRDMGRDFIQTERIVGECPTTHRFSHPFLTFFFCLKIFFVRNIFPKIQIQNTQKCTPIKQTHT